MITAISSLAGVVLLHLRQRTNFKEILRQVQNHHKEPLRDDLDKKFANLENKIDERFDDHAEKIDAIGSAVALESGRRRRLREWAREEHGEIRSAITKLYERINNEAR